MQQWGEIPGSTQETLTTKARYQHVLADHFWRRWEKEQLLSLREHHRLEAGNLTTAPLNYDFFS